MCGLKEVHTVEDGAFGVLHGALGVGAHNVKLVDDQGKIVGEGQAATQPVASQRAHDEADKKP